jgi:hypothetical protein
LKRESGPPQKREQGCHQTNHWRIS